MLIIYDIKLVVTEVHGNKEIVVERYGVAMLIKNKIYKNVVAR